MYVLKYIFINGNCEQIAINHKLLMHSKSAEKSKAQSRKKTKPVQYIYTYRARQCVSNRMHKHKYIVEILKI